MATIDYTVKTIRVKLVMVEKEIMVVRVTWSKWLSKVKGYMCISGENSHVFGRVKLSDKMD